MDTSRSSSVSSSDLDDDNTMHGFKTPSEGSMSSDTELDTLSVGQTQSQDAEESLKAFDAAAKDVLLRLGIKTSDIHRRLRRITKAASKNLPPVYVLYAGSHCGHCWSDAFITFSREDEARREANPDIYTTRDNFDREYRIHTAQQIIRFGQQLMERWPGIAKLVKAYVRNDLGNKIAAIQSIQRSQGSFLRNEKILRLIADKPGRSDGKTEWKICEMFQKDVDFSEYAPSALDAISRDLLCDQNDLTLTIKEERDGVLNEHITEEVYQQILHSFGAMLPEEVEADNAAKKKKPKALRKAAINPTDRELESYLRSINFGSRNRDTDKRLPFTDAVQKYGERHFNMWWGQAHFCTTALRFLLLHPEHVEGLGGLTSERDSVTAALRLGQVAASKDRCKIGIKEVPALAEWKVREYDNLESVVLV